MNTRFFLLFLSFSSLFTLTNPSYAETIKIGLNYDKTGPYATQGLDQYQASQIAAEEINAEGGILGNQIQLVTKDAESNAATGSQNANNLIEADHVKMIFGGSASSVAIAVGKIANEHKVLFFQTLAYSTDTTGEYGRKYVFRECYDTNAAANVLASYVKKNLIDKKFFYITARYNWGYSTEKSMRKVSNTEDMMKNPRAYTPFPVNTDADFKDAVGMAKKANPDVIVLALFGHDMVSAMKEIKAQGLKDKIVIVPNLTLGMAEDAGPEVMEGVIGAIPWTAQLPNKFSFVKGKSFVEKFSKKFNRLPDTSGASAYTILHEYKSAVERAKSLDPMAVVKALEGHQYVSLKDQQYWRDFDHQSIQTVYAVRIKKADEIKKSPFGQDYFEILASMRGDEAFINKSDWEANRKATGKPLQLD